MFVAPSPFSLILLIAVCLADVAMVAAGPAIFDVTQLAPTALIVAALLTCGWLIHHRTQAGSQAGPMVMKMLTLLEGIVFLQVAWIAVRVLNHASMTSALAYADDCLAAWDRAMGFDWEGYFFAVADRPLVRDVMDYSYTSLTFLSIIAFFCLTLLCDRQRMKYFLETFFLTAVVCTSLGMFFPARAAVAHYLGVNGDFSGFGTEPGLYHLASLEMLRSGEAVPLLLDGLPGLVTFPSFHTAAGVVLAAAFWRTSFFPIALLYSLCMIASTPVFGGHYFVDLLAGVVVAVVVLAVYARVPRYDGIFSRPGKLPACAQPG